MLAAVVMLLVVFLIAAATVLVVWLGMGARRAQDNSRLGRLCETVAHHVNGEAEPPKAFRSLVKAAHLA